jgi:hypothetical protein
MSLHRTVGVIVVCLTLRYCARSLLKRFALSPPFEDEALLYDSATEWWSNYHQFQKGRRRLRHENWRRLRAKRYLLVDVLLFALGAVLCLAPAWTCCACEAGCDVNTRGVTACVLGIAMEHCLQASPGSRYCYATREWDGPVSSSGSAASTRKHFLSESGERYATHGTTALVGETTLHMHLERLAHQTGTRCLCPSLLALWPNCTFLRHDKRWMVLHEAVLLPPKHPGAAPVLEFSEDTTRLEPEERVRLTEYNKRLHERGYSEMFILQQSDAASDVDRVRLQLSEAAVACFIHCRGDVADVSP